MNKSIQQILDELIESSSLTIKQSITNPTVIYIPYMMNDAVECFIELCNCRLNDAWDKKSLEVSTFTNEMNEDWTIKTDFISAEYVKNNDSKSVIFFKGANGLVSTIWFENYILHCDYYNYSNLGHFWRSGNDSIRRLNYLIGTIYDKYKYLGPSSCNELEKKLMTLLGFSPFRAFSPIDDSFDVFYDSDELLELESAGIQALINIISTNNITPHLHSVLKRYENAFIKGSRFRVRWLNDQLYKQLSSFDNIELIQVLEALICKAASSYPKRTYTNSLLSKTVNAKRLECDSRMKSKGFAGTFPTYHSSDNSIIVNAYEQQPFTISELEYESVDYEISLIYRDYNNSSEYLEKNAI